MISTSPALKINVGGRSARISIDSVCFFNKKYTLILYLDLSKNG